MCIYMYRSLLRTCSRFKMSTPCVYIYTCICIHMHLHVHDIYRESVCVCVQYVCRDVCVCKHRSLFCTWSRFRMSKPCVYTYIYTCIYIYACIYMYMLYREGLYSMRVSVYVYRSLICTWSRFRMSKPVISPARTDLGALRTCVDEREHDLEVFRFGYEKDTYVNTDTYM